MNGATAFEREETNLVSDFDPEFQLVEEGNEVYVEITLPENFEDFKGDVHSTSTLNRVRLTDVEFEKPHGGELVLDTDLLGEVKEGKTVLGPLSNLKAGKNRIKVWG